MQRLTWWEKFTGSIAKLIVLFASHINATAVVSLALEIARKLEMDEVYIDKDNQFAIVGLNSGKLIHCGHRIDDPKAVQTACETVNREPCSYVRLFAYEVETK